MGLAAAACVAASGLIVGGSSASLALADTDTPSTGEGAEAPAEGGPGSVPGQPVEGPGQPIDGATGTPSTTAPGVDSGGVDPSGPDSKQPPTQVGNGRTGVVDGGTDTITGTIGSSKLPPPPVEPAPQTTEPGAGELLPDEHTNQGAGGEHDDEIGEIAENQGPGDGATGVGGELFEASRHRGEVLPEGDPGGVCPECEEGTGENDDGEGGGKGDDEEPEQPDWCWWPLPSLPTPDLPDPPASGGGGGGGGGGAIPQIPIGSRLSIPQMQLPLPLASEMLASIPPTIDVQPYLDAVSGLATAATQLPFAVLTLPVIVTPAGVPGPGPAGGAGAGGGAVPVPGPRPGMPEAPRVTGRPDGRPASPQQGNENPANVPAFAAGNGSMPAPSYRAGYTDYLRAAGLGEVAAVAVPGVTGILALIGAGGLLGYRQARAGHTVRSSGTGRFMST